jgi:RNA polymerase sigma-70 factor (ECF subfamily)
LERDLVVRAQAGDVDAFAVLVRGSVDRLRSVAYRILRDGDSADDATQRALIAAWDHLGELRDPERWPAWTYRLVVNAAYREVRKERSQHAAVRFIRLTSDAADDDPGTALAGRDELDRAFRELSPDHRAVLVLHHYAGLTKAEVADILGIPVGTVGSRLHNAARRLRAALDRDAGSVLAPENVA